jgi:Family of unknown function (DUF5675)
MGVPGRDGILIHSGNFGGDVEKGFVSHILGCILVGEYFGTLQNQLAILCSTPARTRLQQEMKLAPFTLEILSWEYLTSLLAAASVLSPAQSAPSEVKSST